MTTKKKTTKPKTDPAPEVEVENAEEPLPVIEGEVELPDPTEIVVRDAADVFRRMNVEDERQIVEELQGRALEVMLYSFEIDGKRQTGFSWKGAREAVRTLNARGYTAIRMVKEVEPKITEVLDEEGDEAYRVVVYAEDEKTGGGNWGVATAKKKRKAGNKWKPDTFAVNKALSKAQRNAFEALIPLELVEILKAQLLGDPSKVKVIPGAGSPVEIERPPALDDEEAKAILDEARSFYSKIREIDPLAMPPGQFHALVIGAQHDHDRLRDLVEHVKVFHENEEKIAAEKDKLRRMIPREPFDREMAKMAGMSQPKRLGRLAQLIEAAEKAAGGDG